MAKNNALNNLSSTFTVENLLTVSAGGASITGNSTINGGTVDIGTDATATTYNFGTGAAAKVVSVGSTNGTSSLALKFGTADFTLASATGTIIFALDSGAVTMAFQPAFLANLTVQSSNVTGDGTVYTVIFDSEIYDQGNDFNLGTSVFTCPRTGRYHFCAELFYQELTASHTAGNIVIVTSNRSYTIKSCNYAAFRSAGNFVSLGAAPYADMDVGDTSTVTTQVSNGTKVVDLFVSGTSGACFFSGVLVV